MTLLHASSRRANFGSARPDCERGVVLFIALLVMVALSLAGIALIRSADTATIVAGNLAFKQAAAAAVDRSVEQAVQALFDPGRRNPIIADRRQHRSRRTISPTSGCDAAAFPNIPAELRSVSAFTGAGLNATLGRATMSPATTSYYVIERMCANPGAAVGSNCNLSSAALGADAGTQHYEGLSRAGDAYYRVTVRVDGPRNTVQYAQAIPQVAGAPPQVSQEQHHDPHPPIRLQEILRRRSDRGAAAPAARGVCRADHDERPRGDSRCRE